MEFSLDNIIERWQVDYCTWVRSKRSNAEYPQLPISRRFELLKILVELIKDFGKDKEYFTNSTRDKIVSEVIPRGKHLPKSTIEGFRQATRKQLNWAIEAAYSDREEVPEVMDERRKAVEVENKKLLDLASFDGDDTPINDVMDPEIADFFGIKDE